jgi:7-cyano-7-deazaguanine synthase
MTKALVVLSGGQDSTTCLYWSLFHNTFDAVETVTFDYKQRHSREIEAAKKIATMAGVKNEVVELGPILKGRSPLTNPTEHLERYKDYETMDKIIGDRVELTFVPMRNDLFLTLAANRAVVMGATYIVTGVCQQDNANYPDCRLTFIQAKEQAINQALGHNNNSNDYLRILTPLMNLSKAQSIKLAQKLPGCMDALAFSHTAYDDQYPPTGKDHASTLRAQGFLEAGVPDPLIIRAVREGLMTLPTTPNYINAPV